MRKIVVTLIVASLLSLTSVAPVLAFGWAIPAVIIGTIVNLAATVPSVPSTYGYAAPQAPETYYAPGAYYAPRVYAAPRGYYAPRVYATPRGYYAPRVYAAPRGYYAPRVYAARMGNFAPRGYYPVR